MARMTKGEALRVVEIVQSGVLLSDSLFLVDER